MLLHPDIDRGRIGVAQTLRRLLGDLRMAQTLRLLLGHIRVGKALCLLLGHIRVAKLCVGCLVESGVVCATPGPAANSIAATAVLMRIFIYNSWLPLKH
jgi:hypothetical protein